MSSRPNFSRDSTAKFSDSLSVDEEEDLLPLTLFVVGKVLRMLWHSSATSVCPLAVAL